MIDIEETPPDIENLQHKSEQRNAAQHHVRQVTKERGDKESHLRSVFAHLFLGPRLNPVLERSCRFAFVENYKRSLAYFPIFLLLLGGFRLGARRSCIFLR